MAGLARLAGVASEVSYCRDAVEGLDHLGTRRRLKTGDHLFHAGDASTEVYVVLTGRLKVWFSAENGRETLLAVREPGDLVGELSVLDGARRSATVTALEPGEVVVVAGPVFIDHLSRVPGAALALLRTISLRLRDADRKRIEFGSGDVLSRVSRRLVEVSDRFGGEELRLTQSELAAWTGSSREAVARSLRTLREAGLVLTGREVVRVLDLPALRRLIQTGAPDGRNISS